MYSPRQDRDFRRLVAFASLPAGARYRNRGTNGRGRVQYKRTQTASNGRKLLLNLGLIRCAVSGLSGGSGAVGRENRQKSGDFDVVVVRVLTVELQN